MKSLVLFIVLLGAAVSLSEEYAFNSVSNTDPKRKFEDIDEAINELPDFVLKYVCNKHCNIDDTEGSGTSYSGDLDLSDIRQELKEIKAQLASLLAYSSGQSTPAVPLEYQTIYPVFLGVSRYGRYSFSYSEAERHCEERGAKLATSAQVQAAWERGLDACRCGWVAENHAVFPIQYPREGCTINAPPGVRFGICTWQSQWDAWCFSDDKTTKNFQA